jgi:hypothetical protein
MKQKLLVFLSFLALTTMSFSIPNVDAAYIDEGKSPVSTGCDNNAYTASSASIKNSAGTTIGTIQLRYSSTCQTAWAKVTFNSSMPSGYRGNAVIRKYNSDKSMIIKAYTCTSSGGNGDVAPGQKSCYTPMIYNPVGYYAKAEGYRFNLSNGKIDDALTGFY